MDALFTADYKPLPYWWERSPRPAPAPDPAPTRADILVIGSGYTGLNAALQTARAGRNTVIIDAQDLGFGCSSRNGGQISTSIKPDLRPLAKRLGRETAYNIRREGHEALRWIGDFVAEEALDCDFKVCGRFMGAHTPAHYEALARASEAPETAGLETNAYVVPRSEQHREIETDVYFGGVVKPHHAALDPARYQQALTSRAVQAGVRLVGHCAAQRIDGRRGSFVVQTSRGPIKARDVIVATNGYTGNLMPWLKRRVIPIGSYIIATEPLPRAHLERLIPANRVITDTRKLVVYYRTCPERERILFGARVSITQSDPTQAAPALRQELAKVFPELASVRISHAWMGFVAYTFDQMPHLGVHEGIHFSLGYCGSGVSLASYFGRKIGLKAVGDKEGNSPLEGLSFQTRPYYFGRPWFLAPSIAYYRWADRRGVPAKRP